MKMRIKQVQGALAFKSDKVECLLTSATDVLAYIVGRQALYSERPYQVFANLKIRNKPALLRFWSVTGMIIGTPENWRFNKDICDAVIRNFGATESKLQLQEPVKLYTLVANYRRLLKKVKRPGVQYGNIAARMRLLCRRFPSEVINELLPLFFENRTWPDYSLDQFEKFLKIKHGRGGKTPL